MSNEDTDTGSAAAAAEAKEVVVAAAAAAAAAEEEETDAVMIDLTEDYGEGTGATVTTMAEDRRQKLSPPLLPQRLEDVFESYVRPRWPAKPRKKKAAPKKIGVIIKSAVEPRSSSSSSDDLVDTSASSPLAVLDEHGVVHDEIIDDDDALRFYEDTHEEQDPAFQELERQHRRAAHAAQLSALEAADQAGRRDIEAMMQTLVSDKQAATETSLQKYRQRALDDKAKDQARLDEMYAARTGQNQKKIKDGMHILATRHQAELAKALAAHRQSTTQRQIPEHQAAAEWNNISPTLTHKQQRQLHEFGHKGEEVQRKTQTEYQSQTAKIDATCTQKLADIDAQRTHYLNKLYRDLQTLRSRYLRRHLQKTLAKQKEFKAAAAAADAAADNDDDDNIKTTTTPPTTTTRDKKDVGMGPTAATATRTTTPSSSSSSPLLVLPSVTPRELARTAMEDNRRELRPPSPLRLYHQRESAQHGLVTTAAAAAARHKHRKGVMSQTLRQLTVEIHNEGVWMTAITNKETGGGNNDASSKEEVVLGQDFILWGLKAHNFLMSILAGEIPVGLERFHWLESAVQGGQLRCIITDLRTSDETASAARAASLREQEDANIAELQRKVNELVQMAADADQAAVQHETNEKEAKLAWETATREHDKAKKHVHDLRAKFQKFFDADGNVLESMNPKDKQQLTNALERYNKHAETHAGREQAARQKYDELKARHAKIQATTKTASRNAQLATNVLKKKKAQLALARAQRTGSGPGRGSGAAGAKHHDDHERAATRIKDVVGALSRTAEKRRQQVNQKKSNTFSSAWVQSFPGLPSSLKKSLWHRMHRRKQQIVLRPSYASLKMELDASIEAKYQNDKNADIEAERLRAEQLFLLAMHPAAAVNSDVSSVPPTKSGDEWAEPGWLVRLDVPEPHEGLGLLPCPPTAPLFEVNLSEISSAPGRQAASFLHPSQMRCLEMPLSAFAVASSPAEIKASLSSNQSFTDGDPFHITDEAMKVGYTFTTKVAPPKATPAPRRKSAPKETAESVTVPDPSAQRRSPPVAAPMANAPPTIDTAKRRASSKPESTSRKRAKIASASVSSAAASAAPESPKRTKVTAKPKPVDTNVSPAPPYGQYVHPSTPKQQTQTQPQPHAQQQPPQQLPSHQQHQSPAHPQQTQPHHHHHHHHPPPQQHQQQQPQQHVQQYSKPTSPQHRQQSQPMQAQQSYRQPTPHTPQPHQQGMQPQQQQQQQSQQAYLPQTSPQMAQLRMMQQARGMPQQMPPSPQMANYNQSMQQMQQFYAPLAHANAGGYQPNMQQFQPNMQNRGNALSMPMPPNLNQAFGQPPQGSMNSGMAPQQHQPQHAYAPPPPQQQHGQPQQQPHQPPPPQNPSNPMQPQQQQQAPHQQQ